VLKEKKLGNIGEDIAKEYLLSKKYKILERNFRRPWGEIDIIAEKNKKIIFFEVKTLRYFSDKFYFLPEEQVGYQKRVKIIRTARLYLSEKKIPNEWQIDVIGIQFTKENKCRLRHTKNAIVD
jgi:putative endonuclease